MSRKIQEIQQLLSGKHTKKTYGLSDADANRERNKKNSADFRTRGKAQKKPDGVCKKRKNSDNVRKSEA